jgi:hypothetical protein
LGRKRIDVFRKGQYCRNGIEIPEFFDQLYAVSATEPQPNHNQLRFVTQKQFAGQRRFIRFATHRELRAFRNQRQHARPNETDSMNNEHFCFCPAIP